MELPQFDGIGKLLGHREWLAAYLAGEDVGPISVEMDLTNVCNYQCPNCCWGSLIAHDPHQPCAEEILRRVETVAEAGVRAIIFSGGGEPLMNPAALTAITRARQLGLDVALFTNGVPISEAGAKILARDCSWIRVHLDAVTPDLYRKRHGLDPAKVDRVRQNMMRISAAGGRVELGLGSVINPETAPDIEGLARFAFETGCGFFQAKHDFELLESSEYARWWREDVVPLLRRIETEYRPRGLAVQFTLADYTRRPTAERCHIHHLTTAVNARGDYAFCKRLRDRPDWAAGNVGDASLREVLASKRNQELSRDVTPQNCGINCPYLGLNEFIDGAVRSGGASLPEPDGPSKHANFF